MTAMAHTGGDPRVRQLCIILRGLLSRQTFTSYTDLKTAFAEELVRCYRLPYDGADLSAALDVVESNRPLLRPAVVRRAPPPPAPPPKTVNTADARAILVRYGVNVRGMR